MKEQVVKYTPYGAAALGGVIGYVLHKKFPKFGMAGRVGVIGIGVVSGYFISKAIIDKTSASSESDFNNCSSRNGMP